MIINYQTIMFIIGLGGAIFGVFSYFRNPQIKLEKNEYGFGLQLKILQDDLVNLRDNHIHTLDTKIETVKSSVGTLSIEVAKLGVIINERIPKQ